MKSRTAVLLGLLVLAVAAVADEDCATCGESVAPDANFVLQAHGYAQDQFELMFAWTEQAPHATGLIVAGYHFASRAGNGTFDLYATLDGAALQKDQVDALGILPKRWDPQARERIAEVPVKPSAGAQAAPAPRARSRAVAARRVMSLAPLERARIEAARDHGDAKGSEIIGLVRALPAPVRITDSEAGFGEWTTLPDGTRVWAGAIRSPDAVAQRIRFLNLSLPAGATLIVYDANNPDEAYGPFAGPAPGQDDLWAPSCFAETVAVECHVPQGATGVDFIIQNTAHVFKEYVSAAGGVAPGACNLDFACYPDWSSTGSGVAGIGSVNNEYVLFCTGALVADTVPTTAIPYFLTANHCIRYQVTASNAEFYWLYQRNACGGTLPSLSQVPRTTGGATYLAGSGGSALDGTGNDFTLLRMVKSPPQGLTWLGWSAAAKPAETPVTVIHHPRGDYKRISFGDTAESDLYGDLYYRVYYSEGTTEPGSSGSPLFDKATGQIIGQLWGGNASCSNPGEPDYYGRFDVTYPLVASWLDPDPVVNFKSSAATVLEGAIAKVEVVLPYYPDRPVSVGYSVTAGTATAGVDFAAQSGTVSFSGTVASFNVTTLDDLQLDGEKTVLVTLKNPSGCQLGLVKMLTLTIVDNDDQDGDGLSDQEEMEGIHGFFTDPALADSDGDGLSDREEVFGVYGYFTNPLSQDTDGDGYSDYDEIMGVNHMPTDPTQFTSIPALSVPFFLPTSLIGSM